MDRFTLAPAPIACDRPVTDHTHPHARQLDTGLWVVGDQHGPIAYLREDTNRWGLECFHVYAHGLVRDGRQAGIRPWLQTIPGEMPGAIQDYPAGGPECWAAAVEWCLTFRVDIREINARLRPIRDPRPGDKP